MPIRGKVFIRVMTRILRGLQKYKVRLNISKCTLLSDSAVWCGRHFSKEGWTFEKTQYDKILSMQKPKSLRELEEVVYLLTWLGESLPNIAKVKNYFLDLATRVRKSAHITDRKTRPTDKHLMLTKHWTHLDTIMYRGMLKVVEFATKTSLMQFDSKENITIFTDASKKYWGSVIVQRQRPLMFLSGKFAKASYGWSINDKELFPIIFTLRRFHYLIKNTREVIVRTDHRNLTYLTDESSRSNLKISTNARIGRWNLFIITSGAKLEYIPGEDNTIADLLSRWSYPDFAKSLRAQYGYLTRSSGWTNAEEEQLRKLVQRYGVGSWKVILQTNLLPGKTVSQMVKKFSNIVGRQAFSEFSGMKIDPMRLREIRNRKVGFMRNNIFINSEPTDRDLLQQSRATLRKELSKYLDIYCDIWPLKIEEIGKQFVKKATETDKVAYLQTLLDARRELQFRLKGLEMLMNEEELEPVAKLNTWIILRWVFKELTQRYDNILQRPKVLLTRKALDPVGRRILVYKMDTKKLEDEWQFFMKNRLSPFSPISPEKWTPVTIEILNEARTEDGIPKFLIRKLLWQVHFQLGHVSKDAELKEIQKFHIGKTDSEIMKMLQQIRDTCLHCHRRPHIIRRPLHKNMHSLVVNRMIHMDYLKMKSSYLLVLVEDLSRKVELIVSKKADAFTVGQAILYWRARYGLKEQFCIMTDKGSHFTAELVREVESDLRLSHRFSVTYSPWTNGSAEVTNTQILRFFRALLSEYQMIEDEWEQLVPMVMSYVNHSVNKVTGFTPNQVFNGVNHDGTNVINDVVEDTFPVLTSQGVRYPQDVNKVESYLKKVGERFNEIAEKVFNIKDRLREQRNRSFKNRLKLEDIQYGPGEFVLMSVSGVMKGRNKLKLTWIGPYVIKETQGHNLYILSDPFGKEIEAHASRLRFYNGKDMEFSEYVKHQYLLNRGKFYLKKVNDIRFFNGKYECLCSWYGLEEFEDSWEDLEETFSTAPDPVLEYLRKLKSKEMKQLKERLLRDF